MYEHCTGLGGFFFKDRIISDDRTVQPDLITERKFGRDNMDFASY